MIENILKLFPATRDSDVELYRMYLNEVVVDYDNMLVDELLYKITIGDIHSFDSVSRVRRKLQETNCDLRGSNWNKRHEVAEHYQASIF